MGSIPSGCSALFQSPAVPFPEQFLEGFASGLKCLLVTAMGNVAGIIGAGTAGRETFKQDLIIIGLIRKGLAQSEGAYLFVPSLNAVFGGVLIFSGVYVWTADTPTKELRATWLANLEKIAARKQAIVVPGHMTPDAKTDLSGVTHTVAYLKAFEEELAKAKDSAALKAAMGTRFPGLSMGVALDIGSKVATGEMKWG
jgi:hypothetical protein